MSVLFALFLAASLANILSPGLGAVLVITQGIAGGWRSTFFPAMGLGVGIAMIMAAAVSGLGVLLAAYPLAYAAIKLCGCAFLFYLAWRSWNKGSVQLRDDARAPHESAWAGFRKGVLIQLTNPQRYAFCISVLPQFIDPNWAYVPQVTLMTVIYAFMVFAVMFGYGCIAGTARRFLSGPRAMRIMNRATAAVFALIGIAVLANMLLGLMRS